MNGIRERLPAGALALAGVLVCAPAAFLATQVNTGADADLVARVTRWSWGRITLEMPGQTVVLQDNVASQVLLVVLLALALAGVVVWLVRPGLLQLLLALSGLTLLLGRLVAAVVWRHGETSPFISAQGPGPSYDLLPAGGLELGGGVLLLGGLVPHGPACPAWRDADRFREARAPAPAASGRSGRGLQRRGLRSPPEQGRKGRRGASWAAYGLEQGSAM